MPVTAAPRAAIASARMPPPQPTSSTRLPASKARPSIQSSRRGLISCSGRNSPCGSHQRDASWLNFSSSAGSAFIAALSQKKAPPKRGFSVVRNGYFVFAEPELLDDELLDDASDDEPLALVPPEVELELAPADEGEAPVEAVDSRLPSSAASTRRSGCRQAISFWFLLLSAPSLLHSLPVIGSLLPLPSTWRRLES